MEKTHDFNMFLVTLGTLASTLIGGYDKFINALIIFMICDFVLGVLRVLINSEKFSTWIALKGLLKKSCYIIAIIAAQQGSIISNIPSFKTAMVGFLCSIEFMSIARNLEEGLGIPLYSFFERISKNIREPFTKFFNTECKEVQNVSDSNKIN